MSLDSYQLEHRYTREQGRVFLTGTQALVRIALMQRQLDRQAGRNTAGFVSGYRGIAARSAGHGALAGG